MAINNITWKNVAAPDDAALLKLHGDSYANIGDSIRNIGSAIEGYTDKRQTGINDQISSDIGAQIAGAQNQDQLSQAISSFRNSGYEGNPDILNAAIGTKANQIQQQDHKERELTERISNNIIDATYKTNMLTESTRSHKAVENNTEKLTNIKLNEYDAKIKKEGLTLKSQNLLETFVDPTTKTLDIDGFRAAAVNAHIPTHVANSSMEAFMGPTTGISKKEDAKVKEAERLQKQKDNLSTKYLNKQLEIAKGITPSPTEIKAAGDILNNTLDTLVFFNDDESLSEAQGEMLLKAGYSISRIEAANESTIRSWLKIAEQTVRATGANELKVLLGAETKLNKQINK